MLTIVYIEDEYHKETTKEVSHSVFQCDQVLYLHYYSRLINILRYRSCVRSRSGQMSQWSVFTFWALGSVRRAAKSSHSPKVLGKCPRRILHEYQGHTKKGQGQGQVTKGHYKIKVINIPCDTWVILRAGNDGDIHLTLLRHPIWFFMEIRSRSGQGRVYFSNQYFYTKTIFFMLRIPSGF